MSKGKIRIIGGKWKGKKISFILDKDIRPTPDRAKETLFNWLGQNLNEYTCLDLFAGTGAMGFESLSRGAEKVTFVELNKNLFSELRKIITELKCEESTEIFHQDCMDWLEQNKPENPFDLVFVDPPFNKNFVMEIFEKLSERKFINENSTIYLECEKNLDISFIENSYRVYKEKFFGGKSYRLFKKII